MAGQDGGRRSTSEVGRPAGQSGGPVRAAGALPVEVAGHERAGGERDEPVGGRERQGSEAARGRAQQPVARAEGAGREPTVGGRDERISLVLAQAGVDQVEGDLVAGEEAEGAAGGEAEHVGAQGVARGGQVADIELEDRIGAARGSELKGGQGREGRACAVGEAERGTGADRDGRDDGGGGMAAGQGEHAADAGDGERGRGGQR